jgi:hypothetical protein
MLIEHRSAVGEPDPNHKFDKFIGTVGVGVETPMGRHVEPVEFPIVADSLEEAFAKFRDSAKKHVEKLATAANSQIMVANQMPKVPNQKKLII